MVTIWTHIIFIGTGSYLYLRNVKIKNWQETYSFLTYWDAFEAFYNEKVRVKIFDFLVLFYFIQTFFKLFVWYSY